MFKRKCRGSTLGIFIVHIKIYNRSGEGKAALLRYPYNKGARQGVGGYLHAVPYNLSWLEYSLIRSSVSTARSVALPCVANAL